ncbi:MAG: type II toxin-antitoxin system VapC family toxin [Bacteroidales bacterium]|jgi:PIN domain nuclease of toxin-antitoxin system|nr:type II toxin-antitoxin system VapC family toxin [Bacteroidales bacterium]
MSRYLLDTHIFIWNIVDKKQLPRPLLDELDDYNNVLYVSRASLIEIAIKNRDGKLELGEKYSIFIRSLESRMGVKILEFDNRHLITLNNLTYPKSHKDPFDHLIISQAITDKLQLISVDKNMPFYCSQGLNLFQ